MVLAGRRREPDALARDSGISHKALLEVEGRSMVARVLAALEEAGGFDPLAVCTDAPEAFAQDPELARLRARNALVFWSAEASPATSVRAALEGPAQGRPLLVTTADHPLLTAEMLRSFRDAAQRSTADVVVGVVAEATVRRRFPQAARTWIPLRGERFTGANLFWLRPPAAARAAAFWQQAEGERKRPWRLARLFGLGALLRFAAGRLDLEQALARASAAMGARVEALRLPFAECALDVDRAADLDQVRRLLAAREGRKTTATARR